MAAGCGRQNSLGTKVSIHSSGSRENSYDAAPAPETLAPDQDVQGGWTGGPESCTAQERPWEGPELPCLSQRLSQGSSYPSSLGLQTQTGALDGVHSASSAGRQVGNQES